MADVSIVSDNFDGNELCSTHIETDENVQEMSNEIPPASNEEKIASDRSFAVIKMVLEIYHASNFHLMYTKQCTSFGLTQITASLVLIVAQIEIL